MDEDDIKTKPYVKRPPVLDEEPKTVQQDMSELRRKLRLPDLGPEAKTRPASPTLQKLIEDEKQRAKEQAESDVEIDLTADDDDPERF